METATIEIRGLPVATIEKLDERAEEIGATTPDYVRYLIEKDLVSTMSLSVLFAPVREQIKADDFSDEELDALLEDAREDTYRGNPVVRGGQDDASDSSKV